MEKIRKHKDLHVYQLAFENALRIHQTSKTFPPEEKYSLTDQIRRCSRSVFANLAEAWRKRSIRIILFPSCLTRRLKRVKPRSG